MLIAEAAPPQYHMLAIPLLAVIASGVLLFLYVRHPGAIDSPEACLQQICKSQGLDRKTFLLLSKIARAAGIEHPVTLLTSPSIFDDAVDQAQQRFEFDKRQLQTVGMLRRGMFD